MIDDQGLEMLEHETCTTSRVTDALPAGHSFNIMKRRHFCACDLSCTKLTSPSFLKMAEESQLFQEIRAGGGKVVNGKFQLVVCTIPFQVLGMLCDKAEAIRDFFFFFVLLSCATSVSMFQQHPLANKLTDLPKFELESYISNYDGILRLWKLRTIALTSPPLALEAFRLLTTALKSGLNVELYLNTLEVFTIVPCAMPCI